MNLFAPKCGDRLCIPLRASVFGVHCAFHTNAYPEHRTIVQTFDVYVHISFSVLFLVALSVKAS